MIKIQNLESIATVSTLIGIDEATVLGLLEGVLAGAEDFWRRTAGAELSTSRVDYLNGIQPYEIRGSVGTLALVGNLPNMVENGLDGDIDLRDWLLGPDVPVVPMGKRGAHESADGNKYRAVPFRHATPGTSGRVGTPMGGAYQNHPMVESAGDLGKRIYAVAKKLEATTSTPEGGVEYGGRLAAGMAPKLKPHHSTDIYAGMIKSRKIYAKATQSQYTTFRTISEKSDPEKWIIPQGSPGYGRHFLDQVEDYIARTAPMALEAFIKNATGA